MDPIQTSAFHLELPYVFKNKIDHWGILNYSEDDWCDEFNNKLLKFRLGKKNFTETPYWEQLCDEKIITLKQFFQLSKQEQENWFYFDYKYMKDVFPEKMNLLDSVKWSDIGLFDFSGQDSAMWIGNEGAHTPCHMDTYGCNFVAQIFGRKLWILMSPDETESLKPVRVPYEESSIYSSYNFYTPSNNLLNIKKAYKVVLSPGDVLYVPRHWWHYVENLEVAISVNVWVPLNFDHQSRLKESLVRHYISNICKNLGYNEAKHLLNPNEYKLITETDTFSLVEKCVENYRKFIKEINYEEKILNAVKINCNDEHTQLDPLDIKSYINDKCKTHKYNPSVGKSSYREPNNAILLAKMLINSYCHPKNLDLIKETLLTQLGRCIASDENLGGED